MEKPLHIPIALSPEQACFGILFITILRLGSEFFQSIGKAIFERKALTKLSCVIILFVYIVLFLLLLHVALIILEMSL